MNEKIRWGILGTGNIARSFAQGLSYLPDDHLIAVGSRSAESANHFADIFRIPTRHASYEALAADPEVDVIYIATPHPLHCENTLLCLDAGKAVLCEKPFAINARQASKMIARAREKGLFLMEAMWTRYFPIMTKLRDLIRSGAIGEVRMLQADFGFYAPFDPSGRLFDPALGGGALLDVGIYPLSLASMIFGRPSQITGLAHLGKSGVDEQNALILAYEQGQMALLSSAVSTTTPQEAVIMGTRGRIKITAPWWQPASMIVWSEDRIAGEEIELPFGGNGYQFEAAEVIRCLREGLLESPLMPLDETLSIMETMDTIRAQWGLKYPVES